MAGSNSSIGCAASHILSKCASNFAAAPGSRMTIRSLSCAFSPLVLKFADRVGREIDRVLRTADQLRVDRIKPLLGEKWTSWARAPDTPRHAVNRYGNGHEPDDFFASKFFALSRHVHKCYHDFRSCQLSSGGEYMRSGMSLFGDGRSPSSARPQRSPMRAKAVDGSRSSS